MFKSTLKQYGVWLALALTIAACIWVDAQEENDLASHEVVAKATETLPKMKSLSMADHTAGADLTIAQTPAFSQRAKITRVPQNLFASNVPISPSDENDHVATESAKPVAPALPFINAGKLAEAGQYMVFLIQGEHNLVARTGDVIDKVWLVESIKPPQMVFVYLPLKTKLTLDIGEGN